MQTLRATRREFLEESLVAAALTGLYRTAMGARGARGQVDPNEKIAIAGIGVGAQGTRVMMDFLKMPALRWWRYVTSTADADAAAQKGVPG